MPWKSIEEFAWALQTCHRDIRDLSTGSAVPSTFCTNAAPIVFSFAANESPVAIKDGRFRLTREFGELSRLSTHCCCSRVVEATGGGAAIHRRVRRGSIHCTTVGIIIRIGRDFSYLIAGHLFEPEDGISDEGFTRASSGYSYLDDQSDDDGSDSDYDVGIASGESETVKDVESCNEWFLHSMAEWSIRVNSDDTLGHLSLGPRAQSEGGASSMIKRASRNFEIHLRSYRISNMIPIGYCNRRPLRFPIDYALLAVSEACDLRGVISALGGLP